MALFKLSNVFAGGNIFNLRSIFMPHLNNVTLNSAGLKHQATNVNIPEKPKKPLTPYFKYLGEARNKIIEKNPTIKTIEIPKLVSVEWKKLNESEKKRFETEYAKEKEIYDANIKKYNSQLTPEAVEYLKKEKEEKKAKKEKREMNKLFKETGKPKKPANAFYLFVADNMEKSEYQGKKYMSLVPTFAKIWATLEESEKEKYVVQYKKKHEKYKKELLKWEESVISEGRLEGISSKSVSESGSQSKDKKRTTSPSSVKDKKRLA